MRRLIAVALIVSFFSCNDHPFGSKKSSKDSLSVYTPAPGVLPESKLNYLHEQVNDYYENTLLASGFNGQILVACKGHICFEAYNGTGHIPGSDSINAHTPFHIASTSKTFTAMAILDLWQQGKLQLSDPFSKFFPEFPYKDVTIKTLLNHRSGLPNYTHFLEATGWNQEVMVTNKDVLTELIRHPELVSRADRGFMYCNTNFALLALLLEKLTGVAYPQYMKEHFFEPLGMHDTFVYTPEYKDRINPSYDWFGRLMPNGFLDDVYGDKNIYSTVRDLYRWDQFLYTNTMFKKETMDSAYTPYSFEKPGKKNYGLGWRMLLLPNGKKPIYHNGWWHGNNSTFYRLVEDSATIIILNNKFNRNAYHASRLSDLFGNYGLAEEESEGNNDTEMNNTSNNIPARNKKPSPQRKTHYKRRR